VRAGTTASTSLRGAQRRSNPDFPRGGSLDCFAALAMTEFEALDCSFNEGLHRRHTLAISRHICPSFAMSVAPQIARGRREGRAPAGTRVRMHRNAHGMDYRSRRSPGLPCADGFNGVLRALPGERCTLAPVASAACAMCAPGRAAASPRDLTAATGRQDHTTCSVRGRPGLYAGARCAHLRRSTRPL